MSERQVRREIEHALADLNHNAHPSYAATWQDDVECAAVHIAKAHELLQAMVATYKRSGRHGCPSATDAPAEESDDGR